MRPEIPSRGRFVGLFALLAHVASATAALAQTPALSASSSVAIDLTDEEEGLRDELPPEEPSPRTRPALPAKFIIQAELELDRIDPLAPDPHWMPEVSLLPPMAEVLDRRWSILESWRRAQTSTGADSFDIPISDDPRVELWLSHLQGRGRLRFQLWMSRLTRWAPIFVPVLERYRLPHDLIFLAMVESGLSSGAYSWANAAGPWQFIPATGRKFGLRVGLWVDERRDFERSSDAAARYLKYLFAEFQDWHLAWAAYNAGEGRIRRGLRRTGSRDFWELARTRYLQRETKHYVPKIIAAAIVSKNPGLFGFEDIPYLDPIEWEVVTVTTATDLKTIADACGDDTSKEDLELLNPALYRDITPPGEDYSLRVPHGKGFECIEGLRRIDPAHRRSYRYHPVRRGDTIKKIAERYETQPDEILAFNKITQDKLQMFDGLIVPIPYEADPRVPINMIAEAWNGHPPFLPGSGMVRVHRVRPGDSLWRISQKYRVSIRNLRAWNGLRSNFLRVGQRIRIRGGG